MLHNHYNRKFHKKQKRGVQGLEEGAGISLFNECSFSVRNDENISGMGKNVTCTAYVLYHKLAQNVLGPTLNCKSLRAASCPSCHQIV